MNRRVLGAACVAVLVVALAGFDAVGADCGDGIDAGGSETFTCNAPAYAVMAAALFALLGLVAVLAWSLRDRVAARRRGG